VVSIDTGLNLMGSPYSFSNLARSFAGPAQAQTLGAGGAAAARPLPTSPLALYAATIPAQLSVATYTPVPADVAANTITLNVTNRGL